MWRKSVAVLGSIVGVIAIAGCEPPEAPLPQRPWDGFYTGEAELIQKDGNHARCPSRLTRQDMAVVYNYVNFGDYQGWINPEGLVVLASGPSFVTGSFANGQFAGNVTQSPGCSYRIQSTWAWQTP
jgi:hypothetical protein